MSQGKSKLPKFARKHVAAFLVAAAATVVGGLVLAFILGSSSSSTTITTTGTSRPYGESTNIQFTVDNDRRGGVWALTAPIMEAFSNRDERPVNAARWLPNLTKVIARCAEEGTPYLAALSGHYSHWHWYVELSTETWLPVAGLRQSTEDGPLHLVPCG